MCSIFIDIQLLYSTETVASGLLIKDRAGVGPEIQTKHRNLRWTVFSSGRTNVLGRGKVYINMVCALSFRRGLCNVASPKHIVHVGAVLDYLPGAALFLFAVRATCAE